MTYTLEEQKEHRRILVKKLRSGEYTQTKGYLRNQGGFCCLGIACDLTNGISKWRKRLENDIYNDKKDKNKFYFLFGKDNETLPKAVMDYYGFVHSDGGFLNEKRCRRTLAGMNDNGISFLKIADVIESEPKDMFKQEEK